MVMVPFCLAVCALIGTSHGVSTKLDFGDETSSTITNTTKVEDEDVEVKHTIVVSTKLKNNRRGIHGSNDDKEALNYERRLGDSQKEDSGEVPIIEGYKAVDTTQIRTPDTRYRTKYPDITLESRNLRDEYDIYPNLATHPLQWKPSSFYNNINTWNQDFVSHDRSIPPYYQSKLNRRNGDDTIQEFYCRRCMELSNGQGFRGCGQRTYRTTTPKVKIDGKLVKLN